MILNEVFQLESKIKKAITSSKTYHDRLTTHRRAYANMILHIRVTQETMEIIDSNDTMIPTDIIEVNSETALDQLIFFRDMSSEAQIDSTTTHEIVLTAYALQIALVLEIDGPIAVMNISH